jgi:hypothetical protein
MSAKTHHTQLKKDVAISDVSKIKKVGRSPDKIADFAESLNIAFDDRVRLAMCAWRHNLASPQDDLLKAHQLAVRAADLLKPFQKKDTIFFAFWFAPSIYISRLVTSTFDKQLAGMLADFAQWKHTILVTAYCDSAHLAAIETGQYPRDWNKLLKSFLSEPGRDLFCETQECYKSIILGAHGKKYSRVRKHILRAEELFAQREQDEFFFDAPLTEGGDGDNLYSVDYRLAAIVRHFCGDKPDMLKEWPPTHLWRF